MSVLNDRAYPCFNLLLFQGVSKRGEWNDCRWWWKIRHTRIFSILLYISSSGWLNSKLLFQIKSLPLQEKETGRNSAAAATEVGQKGKQSVLTLVSGRSAWRWVRIPSVTVNVTVEAAVMPQGGVFAIWRKVSTERCLLPRCICRPGWEGEDCSLPVCSPQCMNGGSCSAPGAASCASRPQSTMYF